MYIYNGLILIRWRNRICSQTVSVLACSVGDHGFEPRSGKTKAIKWVHVAFLLRTQHYGEKVKTGWLGIRIMCQEWSDMCTSGLLCCSIVSFLCSVL
jgi:hypothetical protein